MITKIAISFNSNTSLRFTSSSASPITLSIKKFNGDGTYTLVTNTLLIPNNSIVDYSLPDGLYLINDVLDLVNAVTILMYGSVLNHLTEDIEVIESITDDPAMLPHGYDFVSLILLSLMFIGNTTYQNVSYSAANITDYNNVALAINQCVKYLDYEGNTSQSTTAIWTR